MFRAAFAADVRAAFSGEGAYRAGSRWNSPGTRIAFAAEHASLAILETLVHVDRAKAPTDYVLAYATIPENVILRVESLPKSWRTPDGNDATRMVGDTFVRTARSAVLSVPSVVVPSESNFLINPAHPDAQKILFEDALQPFAFDARLF